MRIQMMLVQRTSRALGRTKYLVPLIICTLTLLYILPIDALLSKSWASIRQVLGGDGPSQNQGDDSPSQNQGEKAISADKPQASPSEQLPRSRLQVGESLLTGEALASPSGRYRLVLDWEGDLVYSDLWAQQNISISDTRFTWPVQYWAQLSERGELELRWYNVTEAPYEGFPWVSSFISGCGPFDPKAQAKAQNKAGQKRDQGDGPKVPGKDSPSSPIGDPPPPPPPTPILELTDSGLLHIHTGGISHCTLRRPEAVARTGGRMALLYSGFLRTYAQTCPEHRANLVDAWREAGPWNEVDVHVFSYLEDVMPINDTQTGKLRQPSEQEMEVELRSCFGDALKSVNIITINAVREEWRDPTPALAHACGQRRLDRHLNQYKNIYLAGKHLRRYMMTHGVSYDYILRTRMDLTFWGRVPLALAPSMTPENGILSPLLGMDWVWYSLLHDSTLRQGVSDLLAFGRPAPMFTYMSLYQELIWLRETEKGPDVKHRAMNTHHHSKTGIIDPEHCSAENILAYWLHLNRINVVTGHDWDMSILRGNGERKLSCPVKGRNWNCPGRVTPEDHV